MKASLFLAVALSTAVLAGSPAMASPSATPEVKVYYGDLNLSNPEGNRVLAVRIKRALKRVCDFNPLERQLAIKRAAVKCMTETRTRVVMPLIAGSRVVAR